jgi:hypothetical protein
MRKTLAILFLALPLTALADTPQVEKTTDVVKMSGNDCARARAQNKTCVLTIEDENIEGGRPSAGETTILVEEFVKHQSLIQIRRDFIVEILKTAEDL